MAPESWQSETQTAKTIDLYGQRLNWYAFEGSLTLQNADEELKFQTGKPEFDWFLTENKPEWLYKANMPVVQGELPKIAVLDSEGEKQRPRSQSLRPHRSPAWKKWDKHNLDLGCMEYKIEYNGSEETGVFFNVGDSFLTSSSRSPEEAQIRLSGEDRLHLFIKPDELLHIERQEEFTRVALNDPRKSPLRLKASLSRPDQARGLQLELNLPFKGVRILDNEGNVLDPEKDTLLLSDFDAKGYTLQTPRVSKQAKHDPSYSVKLSNTRNDQIKVRKVVKPGGSPLRKYRELVEELFRISDVMGRETTVKLVLCENHPSDERHDKKLATYTVKNFNQTLAYEGEGNAFVVRPENHEVARIGLPLVAIPLDCDPEHIEAIPLRESEAQKGSYTLPEETPFHLKNFIITTAANEDDRLSLLPTFVTRRQDNSYESKEDRLKRTQKHLLLGDTGNKYWQRLLKYFHICETLDMPFAAFDVFRAAASHPETAAKLFCFLATNTDTKNSKHLLYQVCPRMQDELGFYFHWVGKTHWDEAKSWIKETYDNETAQLVEKQVRKVLQDSEPKKEFEELAEVVLQGKPLAFSGFSPRQDMIKLLSPLGDRVLGELPTNTPKIPEKYKDILPVDKSNFRYKIFFKAPLAVALSLRENSHNLWDHGDAEQIRRNIRYAKWLAPEWYAKALLFCLYKLQN